MFLFIVLTVLNIFGTGCQSENVTLSIDKSEVQLNTTVTLTCRYYGNRTESGILWFNGSDPTGLLYLPDCTQFSTSSPFYDTGRILPTCNSSSKVYTLTITVTSYDFDTEWCCSFILAPDIRCSSNKKITALTTTPTPALTTKSTPTATTTTTVKETNVTSASASTPSTINTTANTGENDSHQLVIIISVSVGAIVLVTVIIIIIICCHKRKKGQTKHKAHHDIARNGSNSTNERNELQKVPKTKSDKGNSNVQNQSSTRI